MNSWTTAAKQELDRYLANLRTPLEQAGADAGEVIEDIKRHIDEEISAARLRVVTVTNLRPLLARIGEPMHVGANGAALNGGLETARSGWNESASNGASVSPPMAEVLEAPPEPPQETNKPNIRKTGPKPHFPAPSGFLLFFGVIIPALTLIIEAATGFCATNVFNPIPTWAHIFLVALVPIVNTYAYIVLTRGEEEKHARNFSLALGVASGIGIFYSIAFIPLALPGLVALIVGLGLLPLAPYFALASSLTFRKHLVNRLAGRPARQQYRFFAGLCAGLCAFLLVDARFLGSKMALHLAANPATEATGLRLLRAFADEETVLRACYERRGREFYSVLFWIMPNDYRVSTDRARRTYFQLYGRPFNSVPAPSPNLVGFAPWADEAFDPERGGEKVGSPVAGLSMQSSRLDATVEPNGAIAYLEWIKEFRNNSPGQAEARCEIELPPGAVVSRLTLWINGEEREAAFAGKSQVRAAYQNVVVVQRRDPVLVTSSGKDRILVQCFPVTPNGGVMKVRIGMTVPLLLDAEKNGILRWPYVRERNFALDEKLEHSFWIDSPVAVETLSVPLKTERTASGHFMARGVLNEKQSNVVQPAVRIRRAERPDRAWATDTRAYDGSYVVQSIREIARSPLKDIVLVVDGSAAVADLAETLLDSQPAPAVRVVVAGETVREFTWSDAQSGARELDKLGFAGGQDNIPALERAWDLAAENGAGAVIWIHGPQPMALSSVEGLRQRFERRPNAVRLFDLPVDRSPNAIATALPAWARVETVSMHLAPKDILQGLVSELSGGSKRYEAVREKTSTRPSGAESNLHLARLWALDETQRLIRGGRSEQAVEVAAKYQLVTEVSGAVVLETAQQYAQAGLQPVSPNSVPVVPEPSTWALLIGGLLVLAALSRRRKRLNRA